ncbi:hypothetical protein [Candidatus Nesciobacter abundans]|uniref:tRNA N6-adenosine threonylcarbamoyltransferase n=1 Tax=Candidatus Nesciobacter abundans TaxID=2601668 RepID=A0A5C0UGW3_9PROT|nr:hypothetical protein [Candidatus Nesciobacter abundans]QEK38937.1 hypothetical protein FZC36_00595 [Candidatus Nesciobacter abundans]
MQNDIEFSVYNKFYLGIETSCDDTTVAIFNNEKCICNKTITHDYSDFGGVIPEYASRDHMTKLPGMVRECLKESNIKPNDLHCIGATVGPGLLGSLTVGVTFAKTLAWSLNIPFVSVNHLEAHLLVAKWKHAYNSINVQNEHINSNKQSAGKTLNNNNNLQNGSDNNFSKNESISFTGLDFPYGVILASGGHTLLAIATDLGKYSVLGTSLDDAVGEILDKFGRKIGLKNPAGKHIEQLALQSEFSKNPNSFSLKNPNFNLPVPLKNDKSCNFSFSGLKTAVIRKWESSDKSEKYKQNLCYALQYAISESLIERLRNALGSKFHNNKEQEINNSNNTSENCKIKNWVFVGGVASNMFIKNKLRDFAEKNGKKIFVPKPEFCSDNAAMVTYATYLYDQKNMHSGYKTEAKASYSLEDISV